jgi:hypothetical protein
LGGKINHISAEKINQVVDVPAPYMPDAAAMRKASLATIGISSVLAAIALFALFSTCWTSSAATTQSTGAHLLTSVPHPTPDPHPGTMAPR